MSSLLEVKNVTKRFGGVVANRDVSFSIEEGKITGLIGPNGAGKSTMFNTVSAVFPPSEGEIWFQNNRIDTIPAYQIAKLGISRTFQNLQVFKKMTVIENVMVGLHTRTSTGILAAAFKFPKSKKEEEFIYHNALEILKHVGLDDLCEAVAGNLSLGKLRLLELARALATKPKLLLLDEIAAGLNHQETLEMGELILKIKEEGLSIFIVEHDMDLVMRICDKIIVLDQGEKIAEGTPKEIQNNQRVIEAYLGADDNEEVTA